MNRKEKPLIVRATKAHLDQICTLEQQIFGKDDAFPRSQLRYLINSRNTAFFIALKSGLPIGYGIALENRLRNAKLKGRIYSLGVVRKYQGQGVGSALLDALENWLLDARATFITLETKATKGGARDFFSGKGYRVTEFLSGYYAPSDGLRMMKSRIPLSRVARDLLSQGSTCSLFKSSKTLVALQDWSTQSLPDLQITSVKTLRI